MIDSKVESIKSNIIIDSKSVAFLHLMLENLFPRSEEEISSLITDGGNDRGADAIHILEMNDVANVSIIQSKYAHKINNAQKNFPGNEVDKLISLITDVINKADGLVSSVNPVLGSKIEDIWSLIDNGKTLRIKIFLISNTLPLIEHERKRLEIFCQQYDFISFEQLHFKPIASLLASDTRPSEEGALECVDIQRYDRIDCDIRGLIANIDAISFIKMISTDDGESIKRHLFDENIRGYLGLGGGFNRQILQSALSEDNHLFWYLNNGITIVAKNFSHQKVRGAKIKIEDFQIVNGAQTSYSLFQAYKNDPDKVAEVVLLVKVFASDRLDISERIAIATNSQARISPRDLKANDSIQKKIAAIFEDNDLLYERKRNQFESTGGLQKIDSRKLGQVILAYQLGEPHQAKTVTDEIFGNFYNRIFSENLDALFLVKLAKLYLYVDSHRQTELGLMRKSTYLDEGNEFIGYTQWHLLYCIKLLAAEEDKIIPEFDEFDKYLTKAIRIISQIAKQHKAQSFYRVFRSSKTKDLIQQEMGVGQLQLQF
jgi:hypothetical protein